MPKRRFYRKIYQKNIKKRRLILILNFSGFFFLFLIFGFLFLFIYYAKDLPQPEKFTERHLSQSTKIYDRSGQILLYEIYGEEKRTWVSLETVPEYLKQAVITTEDANFCHHFGIDFRGIIRAALINLEIMKPVYGGSTIPQQLIRSTFFSTEKTAQRKIREVVLALELDRRHSKDQILEWYLNQVPFGSNCYGVESVSQTYFNKPVSGVSLAEAAVLASLISAPSRLSPYGQNLDNLLSKKDYVLDRMVKAGFITKEEAERAKKEEIKFSEVRSPIKAPHFVMEVKRYLDEKYGEDFLREEGLSVYTTLDWDLQQQAEKAIKEGMEINEKHGAFNASLVAISPKTGQILAMVGSKSWFADPYPEDCIPGLNCLFEPKVNIATYRIGRQPGSAFKPFVYFTAFKKGHNDETIVVDEETNFGVWGGKEYIPQNFDKKFHGEVTLREALAQSINIVAVKVLLDLAGIEDGIKTARELGITTLKPPYGPSIVLGGWEVKLLEMTSAYGVFATEGLKMPPSYILRIEDSKKNILEENKKTQKRVLEKEPCRLLNDILSDNEARAPLFGLRSPLCFENYQVAVKTGTTQNNKDAWTIGYSTSIVAGVWVGNNDNSPMEKRLSILVSSPIWKKFMDEALEKYPSEKFKKPKKLEE